MWCVRKYPISVLVKKHKNSRRGSCLWVFSCFSVFCWLCIFGAPSGFWFWFVVLGEMFYEGLISIFDSGMCLGR